jgi:type I restriction enzyme R subunit
MIAADTCRELVRPKLESSGWDGNQHFYSEQTSFTDGRIIATAGKPPRLNKKSPDFLLRSTRDITRAVVEVKSNRRPAGDGLQQAKNYDVPLRLTLATGIYPAVYRGITPAVDSHGRTLNWSEVLR